jgi:hypothetical protein
MVPAGPNVFTCSAILTEDRPIQRQTTARRSSLLSRNNHKLSSPFWESASQKHNALEGDSPKMATVHSHCMSADRAIRPAECPFPD